MKVIGGLGQDPSDIAYGSGSIWVAGGDDGTLIRIDPRLNAPEAPVDLGPVGGLPQPVTYVTTGEGMVWATRGNRLVRIDPRLNAMTANVEAPHPQGIAAGVGSAWVTKVDEHLLRVDASSATPTDDLDLSHGVAFPVVFSGSLWLDVYPQRRAQPAQVWRLNPSTLEQTELISVPAGLHSASQPETERSGQPTTIGASSGGSIHDPSRVTSGEGRSSPDCDRPRRERHLGGRPGAALQLTRGTRIFPVMIALRTLSSRRRTRRGTFGLILPSPTPLLRRLKVVFSPVVNLPRTSSRMESKTVLSNMLMALVRMCRPRKDWSTSTPIPQTLFSFAARRAPRPHAPASLRRHPSPQRFGSVLPSCTSPDW